MKNIITKVLIGIVMIPMLFACEDWLNVQPKTKIKSEKVFDTKKYFEQALIGVYLSISEKSLYGQELSFYFLDAAAGIYDFKSERGKYFDSSIRDYTKPVNVSIISNIWSRAYNAIANLNNILENIETQTYLDDVTAKLIEGEARGLRAFIHFDLLRMFGPGNLANNRSGLDELAIPYVTNYEQFLSPQLKTSGVLAEIHKDLELAIKLLNYGDKWGPDFPKDNNMLLDDEFFKQDRRYRFNYWAANAIKARAYLWEGDYKNALLFSEKFIKDSPIEFVKESDILRNGDLVFTREFVFGLDVHDIYNESNIRRYFEVSPTDLSAEQVVDIMYVKKERFNTIFEANGVGQSDFRQNHQFAKYDNDKLLRKYYRSDIVSNSNNKLGIIRKPEMYYVAAECLNELGIRKNDALTYLNAVRTSRTVVDPLVDTDAIKKEIEKEYYKDLFGEGQVFYFLKRLGYTSMPYSGEALNPKSFELPIPQSELDFGRE
ncbi:RagB/SusD family nutrient uptake outer membrane protein [Ancylomarina sp. DW003]|nr:RagB/SusD family nutrient uptake outer membrane protein [Ancylomarina sp. DW003]MDE5422138.1 RagB/SusD family nutrient uptake outer membrane protein [Ancylomarina sp. DW003]